MKKKIIAAIGLCGLILSPVSGMHEQKRDHNEGYQENQVIPLTDRFLNAVKDFFRWSTMNAPEDEQVHWSGALAENLLFPVAMPHSDQSKCSSFIRSEGLLLTQGKKHIDEFLDLWDQRQHDNIIDWKTNALSKVLYNYVNNCHCKGDKSPALTTTQLNRYPLDVYLVILASYYPIYMPISSKERVDSIPYIYFGNCPNQEIMEHSRTLGQFNEEQRAIIQKRKADIETKPYLNAYY